MEKDRVVDIRQPNSTARNTSIDNSSECQASKKTELSIPASLTRPSKTHLSTTRTIEKTGKRPSCQYPPALFDRPRHIYRRLAPMTRMETHRVVDIHQPNFTAQNTFIDDSNKCQEWKQNELSIPASLTPPPKTHLSTTGTNDNNGNRPSCRYPPALLHSPKHIYRRLEQISRMEADRVFDVRQFNFTAQDTSIDDSNKCQEWRKTELSISLSQTRPPKTHLSTTRTNVNNGNGPSCRYPPA
jgi:hypothetical protein